MGGTVVNLIFICVCRRENHEKYLIYFISFDLCHLYQRNYSFQAQSLIISVFQDDTYDKSASTQMCTIFLHKCIFSKLLMRDHDIVIVNLYLVFLPGSRHRVPKILGMS